MYPPVDYPKTDSLNSTDKKEDLSYAALRDKAAEAETITPDMIQSAQLRMESAHQLLDATKPTVVPAPDQTSEKSPVT